MSESVRTTRFLQRQRVAALVKYRSPDDPELLAARTHLAEASAEAAIKAIVDGAPPLSADVRARLAALLVGGNFAQPISGSPE